MRSETVYAVREGDASYVYVADTGGVPHRLTHATNVWEADPVLSSDGKLVAYATGPTWHGPSQVWVSHKDGANPHRVSDPGHDAQFPAFSPDAKTIFYVFSRSFGHSSPIAASRRHDLDVASINFDPDHTLDAAKPTELTHSYFYDVSGLAASMDGASLLLTESAYPIGDLIQEIKIADPAKQAKIYQPRIPQTPEISTILAQAKFVDGDMNIVFLAPMTPPSGGNFDYNVYSMSAVTGGNLKQLTHHGGTIESLVVNPAGAVGFTDAEGYHWVETDEKPATAEAR